jgi:uncharacterized membrane protein
MAKPEKQKKMGVLIIAKQKKKLKTRGKKLVRSVVILVVNSALLSSIAVETVK